MLLTALLSITACALPPQDQKEAPKDDRFESVLSKSEQESLGNLLRGWFKARAAYRDAPEGARREIAGKKEEAAKEKFIKEWGAKSKKADVLGCVGDLRAIFAGCFEFERKTGSTDVQKFKGRKNEPFEAVVPKRYRPGVPTPTVLMIRGSSERGWALGNEWWSSIWKPAPDAADFIAILPPLDDAMDLDPPLDWAKPGSEEQDKARLWAVMIPMGEANHALHIDRDRLYLDCGKGSCLFGLRLATIFPQMFAGVVLREPPDPASLRLESLTGMPVLLLRTDATKAACQKVADALNELQEGSCTLLDAKGSYPYPESANEVVAWCKGRKRDLMRLRVVIANNYDPFSRDAYWVAMGKAASVLEVSGAAKPYLDVATDRSANRVTVTAKNVEHFTLLLNDALVDLDKAFTVVVNGKALAPVKLERNLRDLCERVYIKGDPGHLFPAAHTFVVPAGSDAVDKEAGDKASDGKETGEKTSGK